MKDVKEGQVSTRFKSFSCQHKLKKQKLVAWAYDYKGNHEQGFVMKLCCSCCGKVIGSTNNM